MRFYGLCFCLLAVLLVILPLWPAGLGVEKEESTAIEPPLLAVVEPLEQESVPQTEKEDLLLSALDFDELTELKIKNAASGAVETIALEDFVLGAVCSEMPATFHLEALKAQAVSARTWALYQHFWQQEHPKEELQGADFQSDPDHWKGYVTMEQAQERFGEKFEAYWSLLSQAVEETKGQILCYEGQPIAAAYHAISAGTTEAAEYVWGSELPYLQAVSSPGEENATYYTGTVTYTAANFEAILGRDLPGNPTDWFGVTTYTPGGGVASMEIGGTIYKGTTLRSVLGLRSTVFMIDATDSQVTITTKGYGHRVGMSQYGADAMAVEGSDYRQILTHYYQGVMLTVLEN